MTRSDLLLALAGAALEHDEDGIRRTLEVIASEEKRKGHGHVSERLVELLRSSRDSTSANSFSQLGKKGNKHFAGNRSSGFQPVVARRRLQELELDTDIQTSVSEIIDEHRYAKHLRRVGMEPRNRILLVGDPGTGKTSLAEALAVELGVEFNVVRYEDIIGSYLGETSNRLHDLFANITDRPCVLFFDEFDTIAKERGDEHETGEVKRVVSTLLLQIDSLPSHVILIGATNHPELLDRAAWRRFQVVLELPMPTADARAHFARYLSSKMELSNEAFLIEAAREMQGKSYSDVEEFIVSTKRRLIIDKVRTSNQVKP